MMNTREHKRQIAVIVARPEESICFSEGYDQYYQDNVRCHGSMFNGNDYRLCTMSSAQFNRNRKPLNVEVIERPTTSVVSLGMAEGLALRNDFFKAIKPQLKEMITGKVWHIDDAGKRTRLPYVTIWTPPENRIDINRGEWSRHNICPLCGVISPLNYNDKEAVLTRSLDDRMVYLSMRESLLMDLRLMENLDLKVRFPDLRALRIQVLDEPRDGDVLPGDPGWTGEFVPQDLKAKYAALGRKHASELAQLLNPKSGRSAKKSEKNGKRLSKKRRSRGPTAKGER
ncbi:MAG: hypothetical protein K2Y21_04030 [Phycisphaerales bacterium]|nr:hypothetical protein [Phycisphaerales bacterium]